MKTAWNPFNGLKLRDELGNGCTVTVRAKGRPETEVSINQFGQPIVVATGVLLAWDPEESLVPDVKKDPDAK
jgi:hypothetical protein